MGSTGIKIGKNPAIFYNKEGRIIIFGGSGPRGELQGLSQIEFIR